MYKIDKDPNSLIQGDIILDYKNEDLYKYEPKEFYKGILVLSYTCDLDPEHTGISYINICPIFSLEYLIMILFEKFKEECCEKAKPSKRNRLPEIRSRRKKPTTASAKTGAQPSHTGHRNSNERSRQKYICLLFDRSPAAKRR